MNSTEWNEKDKGKNELRGLPVSTAFHSLPKSATLDAPDFLFAFFFCISWGFVAFLMKLPLKKPAFLGPWAGAINLKEFPGTGPTAGLGVGGISELASGFG